MSDLSESQIPPGGWQFFQPQTGWNAPNPVSNTLGQQVVNLIKHRQSNGALSVQHRLSTDAATVKTEILNYNRARLGMTVTETNANPKFQAPRPLPLGVRAAAAAAVKTVHGAALLIDWLGEGAPTVAPELSARRAHTCAAGFQGGQRCPFNSDGDFTKWYTLPIANKIKTMVEAKKELNLSTPDDANLGICEGCLCPMKLKVHVPLDIILKKTKPDVLAQLPPHCWITKRDQ